MDETLEQMQARHRKEQRDLQSRITNKKKNATKKTRKGVNDECAELERQLKERQETELRKLSGEEEAEDPITDDDGQAQTQPRPEPQQQQPPPKKRNRQKERLARRAAEVEAASAAAHSEASAMTDHRSLERAAMQREFALHSLAEREVAPDGHCLFSAVADQLEANGIPLLPSSSSTSSSPSVLSYKIVRQAAAEWMLEHSDLYAGFLDEPLEEYAARIRDTAEWGGQLELSALASAYGVEIRVVQGGGSAGENRIEVVKPSAEVGEAEGESQDERKALWLAYYRHGYGLGEHYNSLRKTS
ncbi:OTU domain-containing protein 2 [Madurella mycetomatis]|uniref:OTU domain-containing protein 2 n=1 Tax=Madurella mycetomatis TaxID=100816 RepID=A0A175VQU8_9PEZI|nr:OTU domain-containing protein 2 [Madurella mycetomatis]